MPNHPLSNPERPELSESKFQAYESIFIEFLETFPAPFRLSPLRGALTTHVVRLREAANAVLNNSAKFTIQPLLNVENFRAVWPKVQVSIRNSEIIIAEPSTLAEITKAQIVEKTTPKNIHTITNPSLLVLANFASLFRERAITEPVLFVGEVPEFTPPVGVAFEKTNEGWMML